MSRRHMGIGGRLFWAFGSVAAMTVAATIVAWISFSGAGESLNRIVSDNIPAVTLAARLAEKGGVITATASALAAAVDEQDRARIWEILFENLGHMNRILEEVDAPSIGGDAKTGLHSLIDSLAANVRTLDTNVGRRFWFRHRIDELVERLRWAHADFLDEVEPLIEDAKFNIGLAVERAGVTDTPMAARRNELVLLEETRRQTALLRLSAAGNLVVGLIARASNSPDVDSLNDTSLFLSEIQGRISSDTQVLKTVPGVLSLRQSLQDLRAFATGENDLFALRRDELKTLAAGRKLVSINRELVGKLQNLITQRVESGNAASLAAAAQSDKSIKRGKLLLLAAAGFSIAVAVLVVWLYVGRNLVRRITSLDKSMRAIADGDLNTTVPTGGTDEISEMATALSTFRDTLAETQTELVQAGKLAALGQLSAGVAHELNQPLAAIRSYAYNAGRLIDMGDIDGVASNLGRISNLVERMGGTVNHLRTLARRPSPQLERVDLALTVKNALMLLEGRTRDENIEISVDLHPEIQFVQAEGIRLEQVLINLLGNAIDAMADRIDRKLSVSATDEREKAALTIRDTGTGIPDDQIAQIFDPFFTTKEVGAGLGLGLAISYNIIKDFGGTIRVISDIGQGSAFTVVLDKA